MPHYHLEGLKNSWRLVRETPSSQIYRATTPTGLEFAVDIHFTPAPLLTVSLNFLNSGGFTDGVSHDIFSDLSNIALRRAPYKIIDYTLGHKDRFVDGNYTIDEKLREVYRNHL